MLSLNTPRILISGTGSSVGKFLLTLGIVQELTYQGLSVSCVISSPQLLQAAILKRLTNRYVRCLDASLLSGSQNLEVLYNAGLGADIVVILGANGLYDRGFLDYSRGADAELAALTSTPVVLVVPASGIGRGVVPIVQGMDAFSSGKLIKGVLLNCANPSFSQLYEDLFSEYNLPKLLGTVEKLDHSNSLPAKVLSERENQTSLPRQFYVDLSETIRSSLKTDNLLSVARSAPEVALPDFEYTPTAKKMGKLAVADDSCFHILFQDNLAMLKYYGIEIVTFSPLADFDLPRGVGGVYLPGGYICEYGEELERNESIRDSISKLVEQGGVIISEGAGTSYLCEQFEIGSAGRVCAGVGLIAGKAQLSPADPVSAETVTIEETILGPPGEILRGVGVREWQLTELSPVMKTARTSFSGLRPVPDGYSPGAQSFCTFSFFHLGSNPASARRLAEAISLV